MIRVFKATPLGLLIIVCVAYVADYAVVRYRATKNLAFGTVTIYHYYSIQKKANKVEYVFNGSEDETCVHALFPHKGYRPCWYVERHKEKKVDL